MLKQMDFLRKFKNKSAQNAIEYLLIFAAVMFVLILALRPNGFLTKSIDNSISLSIKGIENMANSVDNSN